MIASSAVSGPDRAPRDVIADWADQYAAVDAIQLTWISHGQETERPGRGVVAWFHLEKTAIRWPDAIYVEHAELIREKEALRQPPPNIQDFEVASRHWATSRTPLGESRSIGLLSSTSIERNPAAGSFDDEALAGAHRSPWIVARVVLHDLESQRAFHIDAASPETIVFTLRSSFVVELSQLDGRWRCTEVTRKDAAGNTLFEASFADFRSTPGFRDEQPTTRVMRRVSPALLLNPKASPKQRLGEPVVSTASEISVFPHAPVELFDLQDQTLQKAVERAAENLRQERRDHPAPVQSTPSENLK